MPSSANLPRIRSNRVALTYALVGRVSRQLGEHHVDVYQAIAFAIQQEDRCRNVPGWELQSMVELSMGSLSEANDG